MAENTVVVTGVSTGIGWGISKVLLGKGFQVYGTVRKQVDADRLRGEFGDAFTPLLVDVTDLASIQQAAAEVRQALGSRTLIGLVNNAGIAIPGPLLYLPLDDLRRQLEVNLIGPLAVTQAFAPLLKANPAGKGRPGRIVNISSVGGRLASPFIGAYAASKHALEGMSDTLRRELMLHGIDVIVIQPGYVTTAMIDKGENEDVSQYDGTEYRAPLEKFRAFFIREARRKGLAPERLGAVVHRGLTTGHPRARYVVLNGRLTDWTLPRLLPTRTLDKLIAKQLGLEPA